MKAHITHPKKSSSAPVQKKSQPPVAKPPVAKERTSEQIQKLKNVPPEPPPISLDDSFVQTSPSSKVETIVEAEERLQRNSTLSAEDRAAFTNRVRSSILVGQGESMGMESSYTLNFGQKPSIQAQAINLDTVAGTEERRQNSAVGQQIRNSLIASHQQQMKQEWQTAPNSFEQPLGQNLQRQQDSTENQEQPAEAKGELQPKSIVQEPHKENKSSAQGNKVAIETPEQEIKPKAINQLESQPQKALNSETIGVQEQTKSQGEASNQAENLKSAATSDVGSMQQGTSGGNSPTSAGEDAGFQGLVGDVKGVAAQEKQHEPATSEAQEAQGAAQSPPNEVESKAQDSQVEQMEQQQPGTFSANAFKAALLAKIDAIIPDNEQDAENFGQNNELDSVRQDVSSQVGEEEAKAAKPIEEATAAPPDTSGIEPKTSQPLQSPPAGTQPQGVDATKAVPKPKSEAEVAAPLNANSQEIDQEMANANITDEQLAKANEPQFTAALDAKNELKTNTQEAPAAYRQQESETLNQSQAEAQTTSQTQLAGMHGERGQLLGQVMGQQQTAKSQDEQKRSEVATHINSIYTTTKTDVETILSGIDTEVTSKFDTAAGAAKGKFESHVKEKMAVWEKERYGEWYDVTGWDERLSDAVVGLPPEVNQYFVEGKQLYIDEMDIALTDIANFVAQKLNEAKQRISEGKQQIKDYVAKLPQSLQQVGEQAAQDIQSQFEQLEQSVDSKQDELIDSLAQQYSNSIQEVNSRIQEMQAANRGFFDKAKDAIVGTAQTIMQLKDMLMGVLGKAAGAIGNIILDPIGFLGNLVSGVKQGFNNFVGNILPHLKKGLIGWLTGTMAKSGIQMPESFDLKGIFTLVMQVLGLAYDSIKSRTIKALGKNGERIFDGLEKTFDIFIIFKNEGLAGLWQFVQDKIGDLKEMVLGTIQNFVIETVIKQGVLWVISLLNPASAFVKACKMIYDVIMFFIERGSQIVDLVHAVMDSVTAIASGAIGGAASLIENALSKSLPVVISFMASLLGLGGISDKIKDIIGKLKAPIDKAIEWLIAQAVKFAKKIGKKLGFGKGDGKNKKNKEGAESPDEGEGEQLEDSEVGKTVTFSAAGEGHRLWIKTQGTATEVMVASTPTPVEAKLNDWQGRLDSLSEEDKVKAQGLLATARQQLDTTEQSANKTAQEMQEAKQDSANEAAINEAEAADNQTETAEQTLSDTLQQLFEIFDEQDSPLKGALAAYRGIHFQASWDEEKYKEEVSKAANDIVGQPEFSQATQEVAKSLSDEENPSIDELESAAAIVQHELEALKTREALELNTHPDKLNQKAQKQALRRLIKSGINNPTQEQLQEEVETIKREMLSSPDSNYMKPITRGSEGKGTKKGFENKFYVAIHQYVNNKKQFILELSKLNMGRYEGLEFTKIPFISTSKDSVEAAKYAFGKAQDKSNIREQGIVGRIFVYLFSIEEQAKQGVLNIELLHKENKISRSDRLINEAEVAFTGSIPGKNIIGYHDAKDNQTPQLLGGLAQKTAKDKAVAMGGLREWDA